jgi:hypothetical protein
MRPVVGCTYRTFLQGKVTYMFFLTVCLTLRTVAKYKFTLLSHYILYQFFRICVSLYSAQISQNLSSLLARNNSLRCQFANVLQRQLCGIASPAENRIVKLEMARQIQHWFAKRSSQENGNRLKQVSVAKRPSSRPLYSNREAGAVGRCVRHKQIDC